MPRTKPAAKKTAAHSDAVLTLAKEQPWPGPKLTYTELQDLCEVITDGDAGDLNDDCARAFLAVVNEFKQVAGDRITVIDLADTLIIACYQRTKACEAASRQFAKLSMGVLKRGGL